MVTEGGNEMQQDSTQAHQQGSEVQSAKPVRDRTRGKMVVPLLSVLAALSMGVAGFAIVLQIKERENREAKELELRLVQTEKEDLETQLDGVRQDKSRLEVELARVKSEFEDAQRQLAQAVEAQEILSSQVESREQEIGRLSKDLEQQLAERKNIAAELSTLKAEREGMESKLAELEEQKTQLEEKLLEFSDKPTVELEKVVVTGDEMGITPLLTSVSGLSTSVPDGQVIVINREYDFIVMNLGKNDGLAVGQEFHVVRGGEVLGRVKVEKIYEELSAAAILPDSQEDNIQEGDVVRAL